MAYIKENIICFIETEPYTFEAVSSFTYLVSEISIMRIVQRKLTKKVLLLLLSFSMV